MEPKLLNFFDNEINAIDIKERLDEAGIKCILKNELKTQVNVLTEPTEYLSECIRLLQHGEIPYVDMELRNSLINFYSELAEMYNL
ncbi:MAG: hypothetical protein IKW83_11265 [Muribaculaceae bacterium]|nr:hypothetical protein [Muribaculaceae bacterium]